MASLSCTSRIEGCESASNANWQYRAPEHCSVGTFDFKSLMDNPDDVFRCLEIARTRCLCVWGLVSEDQVKRYYREWRSGEGPADEAALLLLLVALGARYIVCGGPTCSQADGLFMEAQKLLPMTGDTHTSAAGLLAAYVMVRLSKLVFGNTCRRFIVIIFLRRMVRDPQSALLIVSVLIYP